MTLTIDSFAWWEVIRGTEAGARARAEMERAVRCLTPAIVLAEVASKGHRDRMDDAWLGLELRAIREASQIVPIDDEIALRATHAVVELRRGAKSRNLRPPGLADALILATARRERSALVTGDAHFRECAETVWIA